MTQPDSPTAREKIAKGFAESATENEQQSRIDAGIAEGYKPEFDAEAADIERLVQAGTATPGMTMALGYHNSAKAAHDRIQKGRNA